MEIRQSSAQQDRNQCLSCGNHFQGKFCNVCGEKIIEEEERKIKYFFGNIVNALTFADSKFLRSFWTLITNPGQISADWVIGKRTEWMRPISMFFLINFIYFLIPMLQTFNTPFEYQVNGQKYSKIAMKMAKEKASNLKISMDELQVSYNAKSSNIAKLLIIFFVIFSSLLLALTLFLKRRYYTDHLFFALEWGSFNILVNSILLGVLVILISQTIRIFNIKTDNIVNEASLSFISLISNIYFLYRASRKFYGFNVWRSVGFLFLGVLILVITLNAYRALLFLTVISNIQ